MSDINTAVYNVFLQRRFGIKACPDPEHDLDIADAQNQLSNWRAKGGETTSVISDDTLPFYCAAPEPVVYCDTPVTGN
jgi:hypothetical protein